MDDQYRRARAEDALAEIHRIRRAYPADKNALLHVCLDDIASDVAALSKAVREGLEAAVLAEKANTAIIEGQPVVEEAPYVEPQEDSAGNKLSTSENADALWREYRKLIFDGGYMDTDGQSTYYSQALKDNGSNPREHAATGCTTCASSRVYALIKKYLPYLDITTAEVLAHFTHCEQDDAEVEVQTIKKLMGEKKA